MTKRDDCKRFRVIRDVGILDDLTGKIYNNYRDICKLLNDEDKRRNEIAEELFDLKFNLHDKSQNKQSQE